MSDANPSAVSPTAPPPPSMREVAAIFTRLGFTAFGGPAAHIAMMRHELVERRQWLDDHRFADLLGLVNLIPGPSSTELAIYLGYLRGGWPGLLLAGACFILPAMLIVLAFAWAYVTFGSTPAVGWLLYGIKPVVLAIIAQALTGLSRTILRGSLAVACALAVLALYLLGVNVLALLLGAGLLFAAVSLARLTRVKPATALPVALPGPFSPLARLIPARLAALGATTSAAIPFSQLTLFLTFLKIGAVLYGSGYVLLAFLRTDLVQNLHWLTDHQLLDAVSIGQFTPGPVFTTATFIGYLVGGLPGALLATLAIFLPAFAFVPAIHRLAALMRRSAWARAILAGVNAAALALMAGVTFQLAGAALVDPLTWLLALAALAILLRFKPNSAWLIAAGALAGFLAHSIGAV